MRKTVRHEVLWSLPFGNSPHAIRRKYAGVFIPARAARRVNQLVIFRDSDRG